MAQCRVVCECSVFMHACVYVCVCVCVDREEKSVGSSPCYICPQCGWGGLPVEKRLHLKGWEPRFHWLQNVGQEVDGAGHACEHNATW